MGCMSWCLGQEYLFTGKTELQLCWYPETPRISINYFHRLYYSTYILINSSATAKCLLRSAGKKRITRKVSFGLEWVLNLNLSYFNWAGLFNLKEKFLVFVCGILLSSESMSDCIIKSMPMRDSRGGNPSETPALELKDHTWFLIRHMADCCLVVESQLTEQCYWSTHSWLHNTAPSTRKSWKPTYFSL